MDGTEVQPCGALVIHPGDSLLVSVPPWTPLDEAKALKDLLSERFPTLDITVVACQSLAVITAS